MKLRKKVFPLLLSMLVLLQLITPSMVFASETQTACKHHTHDEISESSTKESICNHQHNEICNTKETNCLHTHTDRCFSVLNSSEMGTEPTLCVHECNEEGGCVATILNCTHSHDENCGYAIGTEVISCTFNTVDCENCILESAEERVTNNVNSFTIGATGNYPTFKEAFKDKINVTGNVKFLLMENTTETINVSGTNGITNISITSNVEGIKRKVGTLNLSGVPCLLNDLDLGTNALDLGVKGGSDYTASIEDCIMGIFRFGYFQSLGASGAITLNMKNCTVANGDTNGRIHVGFGGSNGDYIYNGPVTFNMENVTAGTISAVLGESLSRVTFNETITYNLTNCNIKYVNGLAYDGSFYSNSGNEVQRITANELIDINIDGGTYQTISGGSYKIKSFSGIGAPKEQSHIVNKGVDIDLNNIDARLLVAGHNKRNTDDDGIAKFEWHGDADVTIADGQCHEILGVKNTNLDGNINFQLSQGALSYGALIATVSDEVITGQVHLALLGQGIRTGTLGGFDTIDTGGTIQPSSIKTNRVTSTPVTINTPANWGIRDDVVKFITDETVPADTFVQGWVQDEIYPYTLNQEYDYDPPNFRDQNWYLGKAIKVAFKDQQNNLLHTSYIPFGTAVSEPSVQILGHSIDGWYQDQTLPSAKWNFSKLIYTDKTLWGHVTPNVYTVRFNSNGGTGNMSEQNFTYDVAQQINPNLFQKSGKMFAGWSRDSGDNNSVEFTDGQQALNLVESGSLNLYAVWIDVPESIVTFKVENGTWADDSTADLAIAVPLVNGNGTLNTYDVPTGMKPNIGYGNGTWNVEPNTTINGITGDVTYVYTFVKNITTATVIFESNGGSSVPSISNITYGSQITKPKEPTKKGYTFIGWYKDTNLENQWNFADDVVTGDMTLYAKWTYSNIPQMGDVSNVVLWLITVGSSALAIVFVLIQKKKRISMRQY